MREILERKLQNDLEKRFKSLGVVRSFALKNDKNLLEFLLNSSFKDEYKIRFFEEVCGALVFKKEEFLKFLDLHTYTLGHSYFGNKIGLGFLNGKYLKNQEEVVLNFPFKDCVLKGGQAKDEQKTKEMFFNEILARSEIDVLFCPKALQNFEFIGTPTERTKSRSLKSA